jgi:hypothetical protein
MGKAKDKRGANHGMEKRSKKFRSAYYNTRNNYEELESVVKFK